MEHLSDLIQAFKSVSTTGKLSIVIGVAVAFWGHYRLEIWLGNKSVTWSKALMDEIMSWLNELGSSCLWCKQGYHPSPMPNGKWMHLDVPQPVKCRNH